MTSVVPNSSLSLFIIAVAFLALVLKSRREINNRTEYSPAEKQSLSKVGLLCCIVIVSIVTLYFYAIGHFVPLDPMYNPLPVPDPFTTIVFYVVVISVAPFVLIISRGKMIEEDFIFYLVRNQYLNEPNAKMLSLVLTNLKGIMNAALEQQAILVRG